MANNALGIYTYYRDSSDISLKADDLHFNADAVVTISADLMENVF